MFLTAKEAAEKWGISDRRVRVLCSEDKIPGAYQEGRGWKIPVDAKKPEDSRYKSVKSIEEFIVEYTYNSNAIEGSTLTLRETDMVLRGLTIDKKSLLKNTWKLWGIRKLLIS